VGPQQLSDGVILVHGIVPYLVSYTILRQPIHSHIFHKRMWNV